MKLDPLPLARSDISKEEIFSLYQIAHQQAPNLEKELKQSPNPQTTVSLFTLLFLSQERLSDLQLDPNHMWSFTVTRALEAFSLQVACDPTLDPSVRERFRPKPTGGGINTSYFLQSPTIKGLLNSTHLESLQLNSSSVYKPRHQTMGSLDSPIRYGGQEHKMLIGEETDNGILLRTRYRKLPVMTLLCSREELPKQIEWEDTTYRKYQGTKIGFDPGSETLAEALFYQLARYCDQKGKQLGLPVFDGFCVPRTTIEQFSHPDFGPHHTVGSRQDFVANAQHFASKKAAPLREKLKGREILKIAFLDILGANVDRHEGNLLIRKNQLFHVDAGYAFPSFKGAMAMELSKVVMSWFTQAIAQKCFPQEFARLAEHLDPFEICLYLRDEVHRYRERYPDEDFSITPGQELVLHGTLSLLKLGTEYRVTPSRMANFIFHQPILDSNNEAVMHEQKQKVQMGGELWAALMLACLKGGYPYKSGEPIPLQVLQQVPQMVANLITRETVLRHLSHATVEARQKATPMEFLQRVFAGDFDELP